ncbi:MULTISPECIES: hypothetical protein [unclassified Micromonospora]|uniref:hypothetical protein n=1 Tax=unclassified Micromonospora TaxID=2617518 RepID=UPI00332B6A39
MQLPTKPVIGRWRAIDGGASPDATAPRRATSAWAPLKLASAYLLGTFALFLTIGRAAESPDLVRLTLFVLAAVAALCLGYAACVLRQGGMRAAPVQDLAAQQAPRPLVAVCATYVLLLGIAQLGLIGVSSPIELAHAVTHPGERYFHQLQQEGQFSRPVQVLTLLAVLYPLLIPLAVWFWASLGRPLQLYVLASIATYTLYFMAIGILKGLGDMLIWWGASYLLLLGYRSLRPIRSRPAGRTSGWRHVVACTAVLLAFVGYMSFNQIDRARTSGQGPAIAGNPVVAQLVGDDLAAGLAVTLSYPTHGYLGLSHNLSVPFEWTRGLGASPALGSYLEQYTGINPRHSDRYTARTEAATGWPDGMYWSTIFPWLASDLTYPGSIAFMALVGWFLAKFWWEAIRQRRLLSMALFCQLALLIAFVPANNQLGQTRPALIAFVSLCALSVSDRLRRWAALTASSGGPRVRDGTPVASRAEEAPPHRLVAVGG